MQDPAPTAPIAPPAPAPQAGVVVSVPGTEIRVTNVQALRAIRRELSNQITSATSRRNELAEQLRTTTEPGERAGLEARIGVLDERIVQLERDLAETGRQLTSNPLALAASSEAPGQVMWGGFSPGQATAMSLVFTIFVLAPLAFAAARLIWRRARVPNRTPLPPEASQRLERIEQSVDTMAVEVERVTEGQRFITRLLTERAPALVAAPAAEPARLHAQTIHTPGSGSD